VVTKLDRLARSTRDLLNTLAAIGDKGATFKSLGDAWADTTTPAGKLMLTVLGALAEYGATLDPCSDRRRTDRGQGERCSFREASVAYAVSTCRGVTETRNDHC
jgi:hypothetical protein